METEELVRKLGAARLAIAKAEADLQKVIDEIQVAPRADKVGISEALEDAFTRLRTAKAVLVEVETEIPEHDR